MLPIQWNHPESGKNTEEETTKYGNEFYGIHNAGQKQTLTVLSDTYEISVNDDSNYLTIFYEETSDGYYALLHGETLKDTGTFGSFYPMAFYGEKSGAEFTITKVEEYRDDTLRSCVEIGAEEIGQYFNSNDFNSITVYRSSFATTKTAIF